MIRINLLPFRIQRKKEIVRRQISLFILSIVTLCLGLYLYSRKMDSDIKNLNIKIEQTQKEIDRYNAILKEIEEIKKNLAILNQKIAVIKNLSANRKRAVTLLETLSDLVVQKRMWYTSLTESGENISLKGIALDDKTVADFMERLEQSPLFTNVNLGPLKLVKIDDLKLKSFSFIFKSVSMSKPKEAKTQPKPKKK
jgi:type IV pilus assembly protein PilN